MQSSRLYEIFRELTAIYSPAFGERDFCSLLKSKLSALGAVCKEDDAGSKIGGNCGNLYGFLAGELPGAPLLFSAHMDTVEPAAGKESVLYENGRITSDGTTILGADDVSGIAVILEALTRLRETGTPHRSIELLFPVAEEHYGLGSALAGWLKQYARATKLPINCEYLGDERVRISENSQIITALQQGGAVVLRVHYGCWHFVTLTGISGNSISLFDPYYRKRPFKQTGIELITDKPCSANRRVSFEILNQTAKGIYTMGPDEGRAAVLLFNVNTRKTPEKTIEYFL